VPFFEYILKFTPPSCMVAPKGVLLPTPMPERVKPMCAARLTFRLGAVSTFD
jgi:hypothetical protein